MKFDKLPNAEGQRQTFAAGRELKAEIELAPVYRKDFAGMEAEPAGRHAQGLRVILREIEKMEFDTGIS